ncbi:MAG: epoxyqueuosine reductase [Spirochaetales bacterium]|nr:epoxyqueuosine reductase [Spirochaetales bacterium]
MGAPKPEMLDILAELLEDEGFRRVGDPLPGEAPDGIGHPGGRGAPGLWGPIGAGELAAWTRRLSPETGKRYGAGDAKGAVACALAYEDTGDAVPEGRPRSATVGRFARDHSYAELARRLARVRDALRLRFGWPKSAVRVLVNSRAPEKPLAVLAGLGPVGRNSLVLVRDLGPGVVLGALLLPIDPVVEAGEREGSVGRPRPEAADFEPGARCASCRACVDACPTGAVLESGGIDPSRCVQGAASSEAPVTPELAAAWSGVLYGCDRCLVACPHFVRGAPGWQGRSAAAAGASTVRGPGARVSLDFLLRADDRELEAAFRGTALGLGWMTARLWRRNAALAARSLGGADRPEGDPICANPAGRDAEPAGGGDSGATSGQAASPPQGV